MSNNFFSFKEFTVHQDMCAMKVCTDACLFGAWTVSKIIKIAPYCKSIIDIGAGTGLLSLIAAQKTAAGIDAVEIDQLAYGQAASNFNQSPWKNRLTAVHSSILEFDNRIKYDFIISNPPFFEDSLRSPDLSRNTAMHDSELTLEDIAESILKFQSGNGFASILLPFSRTGYFEMLLLNKGLYIIENVSVKQTPAHPYFRSMLLISKNKAVTTIKEEIIIHNTNRQYTTAFTNLLKDYYLHL